jgi:hypothetical protein
MSRLSAPLRPYLLPPRHGSISNQTLYISILFFLIIHFFRPDYTTDDIKRVERLAIFVHPDAEALPRAPQSLSKFVHERLCDFANVRELYFVVKRYNPSDCANLAFSTIKHDCDTAIPCTLNHITPRRISNSKARRSTMRIP